MSKKVRIFFFLFGDFGFINWGRGEWLGSCITRIGGIFLSGNFWAERVIHVSGSSLGFRLQGFLVHGLELWALFNTS